MQFTIFAVAIFLVSLPAQAERVENPIAVFAGLDKVTGLITAFEAKIGEEKRFGGLLIKPDICYSRPVTEEPKTTSFVEVDEIESTDARRRIFTGWMFAESPGLNAVEHPVYDVWLTGCRDPNAPPPAVEEPPDTAKLQNQIDEEPND
jgi:hypothetical protein